MSACGEASEVPDGRGNADGRLATDALDALQQFDLAGQDGLGELLHPGHDHGTALAQILDERETLTDGQDA